VMMRLKSRSSKCVLGLPFLTTTVEFPTSVLSLTAFHSATIELASQALVRIRDIKTKLRNRQADLIRLTDRSSDYVWRCYLLTITSELQRLARDGCYGDTTIPFFGGTKPCQVCQIRRLDYGAQAVQLSIEHLRNWILIQKRSSLLLRLPCLDGSNPATEGVISRQIKNLGL
jgi:hypothetical protein